MKQVIIVVPAGAIDSSSSITGSFQVLHGANQHWQKQGHRPGIEICLAGVEPELKLDFGFVSIHPVHISEIQNPDLVIIPALNHDYEAAIKKNQELIDWIREQYVNGAEVASICTGAFLLAATGLLDGRRCSTHWDAADELQRIFPKVDVRTDIVTAGGKGLYTNGGGYSFLNLALFLVEKYFDRSTAILCSKQFQIDMDRTSQSPFAIFRGQKSHGDELIEEAQTYIEENLSEKITVDELASKFATSRRNFDRRFYKATGNTPIEYQQRVKVEVAKKALETGRKSITEVMDDVGYTDDKAFREMFKRLTGMSPLEYKSRFNKKAVA
jgi:transcriptional regulator GlxA family with amidase domain